MQQICRCRVPYGDPTYALWQTQAKTAGTSAPAVLDFRRDQSVAIVVFGWPLPAATTRVMHLLVVVIVIRFGLAGFTRRARLVALGTLLLGSLLSRLSLRFLLRLRLLPGLLAFLLRLLSLRFLLRLRLLLILFALLLSGICLTLKRGEPFLFGLTPLCFLLV